VNAHLVPIKISFYSAEALGEDSVSQQVAKKELELAATYLHRTIGSLKALSLGGLLPDAQRGFLEQGEELKEEIARRISRYDQSIGPEV
jgi:hypothetical protein